MKHLPYPQNQTREKARTVKSQCHIIGTRAPGLLESEIGEGFILVLYGRENYNGKARGAGRIRG